MVQYSFHLEVNFPKVLAVDINGQFRSAQYASSQYAGPRGSEHQLYCNKNPYG